MNREQLTPERSLEIITQAISEAKTKFEEDGLIYVFWGSLTAIAAFSQFFLMQAERYDISFYPWFLMPFGGIFSFWYYARKNKGKSNKVSEMVSICWATISMNILILSFGFAPFLQASLIPLILIFIGMGMVITGKIVRSNVIFIPGLLLDIIGFVCFAVEWIYQPLLMGVAAILGFLIPGLILMRNYKRLKNA